MRLLALICGIVRSYHYCNTLTGIFEIPITSLCETSSTRLIRSLDKQFLKNLREKMARDPSSPGVPPIAVVCKDTQNPAQFSKRLKDIYKYEVLGGQHTSQARTELHRQQSDNPLYATILAEVYVGLSDDEALHLHHGTTQNDSSGLCEFLSLF